MNRNLTLIAHYVFDQILPPALRDSRWFMAPFFYLLLGRKARAYLDFKDQLSTLSEHDLQALYDELADTFVKRDTDLNQASIDLILQQVCGPRVLDIACGHGWLTEKLAAQGLQVTGADFIIDSRLNQETRLAHYEAARITDLHYADGAFDTVICAHTLEHVRDIRQALQEVRRVCGKRLIIVLPCQREYRYTFDLHIHFFPYAYKLRELVGPHARIIKAGGDFVVIEDMT